MDTVEWIPDWISELVNTGRHGLVNIVKRNRERVTSGSSKMEQCSNKSSHDRSTFNCLDDKIIETKGNFKSKSSMKYDEMVLNDNNRQPSNQLVNDGQLLVNLLCASSGDIYENSSNSLSTDNFLSACFKANPTHLDISINVEHQTNSSQIELSSNTIQSSISMLNSLQSWTLDKNNGDEDEGADEKGEKKEEKDDNKVIEYYNVQEDINQMDSIEACLCTKHTIDGLLLREELSSYNNHHHHHHQTKAAKNEPGGSTKDGNDTKVSHLNENGNVSEPDDTVMQTRRQQPEKSMKEEPEVDVERILDVDFEDGMNGKEAVVSANDAISTTPYTASSITRHTPIVVPMNNSHRDDLLRGKTGNVKSLSEERDKRITTTQRKKKKTKKIKKKTTTTKKKKKKTKTKQKKKKAVKEWITTRRHKVIKEEEEKEKEKKEKEKEEDSSNDEKDETVSEFSIRVPLLNEASNEHTIRRLHLTDACCCSEDLNYLDEHYRGTLFDCECKLNKDDDNITQVDSYSNKSSKHCDVSLIQHATKYSLATGYRSSFHSKQHRQQLNAIIKLNESNKDGQKDNQLDSVNRRIFGCQLVNVYCCNQKNIDCLSLEFHIRKLVKKSAISYVVHPQDIVQLLSGSRFNIECRRCSRLITLLIDYRTSILKVDSAYFIDTETLRQSKKYLRFCDDQLHRVFFVATENLKMIEEKLLPGGSSLNGLKHYTTHHHHHNHSGRYYNNTINSLTNNNIPMSTPADKIYDSKRPNSVSSTSGSSDGGAFNGSGLDTEHDYEYGPGIVDRLKHKFMALASNGVDNSKLNLVKRCSSLEELTFQNTCSSCTAIKLPKATPSTHHHRMLNGTKKRIFQWTINQNIKSINNGLETTDCESIVKLSNSTVPSNKGSLSSSANIQQPCNIIKQYIKKQQQQTNIRNVTSTTNEANENDMITSSALVSTNSIFLNNRYQNRSTSLLLSVPMPYIKRSKSVETLSAILFEAPDLETKILEIDFNKEMEHVDNENEKKMTCINCCSLRLNDGDKNISVDIYDRDGHVERKQSNEQEQSLKIIQRDNNVCLTNDKRIEDNDQMANNLAIDSVLLTKTINNNQTSFLSTPLKHITIEPVNDKSNIIESNINNEEIINESVKKHPPTMKEKELRIDSRSVVNATTVPTAATTAATAVYVIEGEKSTSHTANSLDIDEAKNRLPSDWGDFIFSFENKQMNHYPQIQKNEMPKPDIVKTYKRLFEVADNINEANVHYENGVNHKAAIIPSTTNVSSQTGLRNNNNNGTTSLTMTNVPIKMISNHKSLSSQTLPQVANKSTLKASSLNKSSQSNRSLQPTTHASVRMAPPLPMSAKITKLRATPKPLIVQQQTKAEIVSTSLTLERNKHDRKTLNETMKTSATFDSGTVNETSSPNYILTQLRNNLTPTTPKVMKDVVGHVQPKTTLERTSVCNKAITAKLKQKETLTLDTNESVTVPKILKDDKVTSTVSSRSQPVSIKSSLESNTTACNLTNNCNNENPTSLTTSLDNAVEEVVVVAEGKEISCKTTSANNNTDKSFPLTDNDPTSTIASFLNRNEQQYKAEDVGNSSTLSKKKPVANIRPFSEQATVIAASINDNDIEVNKAFPDQTDIIDPNVEIETMIPKVITSPKVATSLPYINVNNNNNNNSNNNHSLKSVSETNKFQRSISPSSNTSSISNQIRSSSASPTPATTSLSTTTTTTKSSTFRSAKVVNSNSSGSSSIVFDFRDKKVKPKIALQPAPFGAKPIPKRIIKAIGGDEESDEDDNNDDDDDLNYNGSMQIPTPCGICFIGEMIITGKSNLLAKRNKNLSIQFNESKVVFEYPFESFESDDEEPTKSKEKPSMTSLITAGNSSLASYKPSQLNDETNEVPFQLGITKTNRNPVNQEDRGHREVINDVDENPVIKPARIGETVTFSQSATRSDLLF